MAAHDLLDDSRYKALFMTELEIAYMWTGKAIRDEQVARAGTRHEPSTFPRFFY